MGSVFICPLCGNKDEKYIGYKNGVPYCRRCISFIGREAIENYDISDDISINIKYKLTKEQRRISNEILNNFKNKKNQLVYAVCGAGKTELVFEVIEYCFKNKLKVGFAVPRRDVVIELAKRFQSSYKNCNVIAVFGGNTTLIEADLICLTTHQLYRYDKYFDLLILDEIDAFPYNGDEVLYNFFKRSVKGNYVLMTATPTKELLEEYSNNEHNCLLTLFTRYHNKPIPIPEIKIRPFLLFKLIFIIKKIKQYEKENKPLLIFVPTIYTSKYLFNLIKNFAKHGYFINSHSKDRKGIIEKFRKGEYTYLVATAVLERGVTIKNLQIIIFMADNNIYNSSALIQISGRAGRVINYTEGEVIFLGDKKTKAMEESIEIITNANSHL
ncbi:MAG: DEAD/DEAH box helicase family protein [Mollicutes bacterium]|nr:DEAD/DEAH box helicase family protein [Mollicutes bacterium]MDD7264312.1 helicase-related protein [bacterium]MDY4980056.1 helicase-related protein [Candidatus Onthovivens sp.]